METFLNLITRKARSWLLQGAQTVASVTTFPRMRYRVNQDASAILPQITGEIRISSHYHAPQRTNVTNVSFIYTSSFYVTRTINSNLFVGRN